MKKFGFLVFSFIFLCCSRNDDCGQAYGLKYSPAEYSLFFEFSRHNGISFEDDEIQISNRLEMISGQLQPYFGETIEWAEMGRLEENFGDELSDVFGLKCEPCTSAYVPLVYGFGSDQCQNWTLESWERNQYYLLRFPNKDIDTLLIKDSKKVKEDRMFLFYLNGNEQIVEGGGSPITVLKVVK